MDKREDICRCFSDFWKRGLHDAKILSISEVLLEPDWKARRPQRNCLEIELDCRGALYEEDISKVLLYNYKVKRKDFDFGDLGKAWWLGDRLTPMPGNRFLLEIAITTEEGREEEFAVEFEDLEVVRNSPKRSR